MRSKLILASLLLCLATPAMAQVSISVRSANVSIGVNFPVYPNLVRVPGYPVYYAPDLSSNYFFYDGYYWVYNDDYWYSSEWYNGPWYLVEPIYVPVYLLRVPVRYYRLPPRYFGGWSRDAAPRWGDHWGNDWSRRRGGWDRWDRNAMPAPAPLPTYQRQFSGNRYPTRVEQQRELQTRNYNYQPRTRIVREEPNRPPQRPPVPGGAAREPSRDRPDARPIQRPEQRSDQRPSQRPDQRPDQRPSQRPDRPAEPFDAPRQREAPARDDARQPPSPPGQPGASRQQSDPSPRDAGPPRNDRAPQPDRRPNMDRDTRGDERNDRGNRDNDRGR